MTLKFVNRFKWQCINCKTCQVCNTNTAKLTKCNTCDRTFHENCFPMHISFGKPQCGDCISCKNCNKTLSLLTISNQNDLLQIKGYRVCEECWKYYKNVMLNLYRNTIAQNVLRFIKLRMIWLEYTAIDVLIVNICLI
jgi:hypothetical protein